MDIKTQYINYMKVIIRIHETNGLRFRSEVDQQIYLKIVQYIRYLQRLQQSGRINEQQIEILERLIFTIHKMEITYRFNYTKAVRSYINRVKVTECIYIWDENIRRTYIGLISQIKQIESQFSLEFKDHQQMMTYIRLIRELENIEKYVNSGMSKLNEEMQFRIQRIKERI